MSDTTSRLLRLLSLLQTRREWTGSQLAQRLDVSDRTLRRDVDRLRELGYPVHSARGTAGGYRLEAGAAVPPLLLDDDEAVAIAVGLRTAAGGSVVGLEETSVRALAKLEQVLPAHLRGRVHALQAFTVPMARSRPSVEPQVLTTLAQACRDCERLRFEYADRDGTESRRHVEPHRLVAADGRWYLVAWDTDRGDWRTFRVDRLSDVRVTGVRCAPREVPGGDAAAYVARSFAAMPARYEATVTLYAPLAVAAERLCPGQGVLEEVADDRCILRARGDSLEWLALGLGLLDLDFLVHDPAELVTLVRQLGGRFSAGAAASVESTAPSGNGSAA